MNWIFVWTFSDVFAISAIVLFVILFSVIWLAQWFKQVTCKHDGGVMETSSCDAICRKCSKNLGFIGAWRNREAKP